MKNNENDLINKKAAWTPSLGASYYSDVGDNFILMTK